MVRWEYKNWTVSRPFCDFETVDCFTWLKYTHKDRENTTMDPLLASQVYINQNKEDPEPFPVARLKNDITSPNEDYCADGLVE